jgi:hypothetical protein
MSKLYFWDEAEGAYRVARKTTLAGEWLEKALHAVVAISALCWVTWLIFAPSAASQVEGRQWVRVGHNCHYVPAAEAEGLPACQQ